MSGTYTVGTGGSYDYSSMADAGMAIKAAEFTGDVTLLICTDLTETINTGIVNKSEYTLTIRPDKDEDRTITYTTAKDNTGPTGVFVIGGDMTKTPGTTIGWASVPTKNVIVDGAAEGKTTPRLKITNEVFGTNVLLYGDVQDVVIKNCILVGRSSSTAYALVFRSENYSQTSKDIAPQNCLVENCVLQSSSSSSQTVYFQGNQAHSEAGWPASITIRNSTIKAHTRGIYVRQVCNLNVEGCTFDMSNSSGGILAHAIMGEGARGTINVKGNKFIKNSTANYHGGTYGLQTITASGGADVWVIENNYFAGYDALKAISNTTNGTEARLVAVRCGDYCEVRHNTFHMPNLTKDQASKLVSASPTTLLWLAGSHQYPVQNNIFVCEETTANVSLIRGGLNENVTGNVFYHEGGNAAIVAAAPSCMTFADLETSYPTQAATSKWTNVTFADAANGDLSLAGSSDGDLNLAVDRLAEVLTDINGTARREKTYAGAYEGSEFPAEVCSVTTMVVPVGGGTVEGAGDYAKGASVTLTATSNDHYDFVNWTEDGAVVSTTAEYSFTVTKDIELIANFQEHAKYTITAVANDENMGTVTGGDTYYAGESATLKATAKSGYVFAGWADGEKNATRTVTVSGDAIYTANFQAIAPRAWAYDLKVADDGDNYKFTFNATAAGSATLLFADIDGNPVAPTSWDGGLVNAGANTVLVAKAAFTENKDVYWSVKMDGEAIPAISEITDQSRGIYDFYNMMGVVVDNNPNSDYFGKIYIQQSYEYPGSGNTAERNKTQEAGIFIYDQGLNELNPTNVGYKPTMPTGYTAIGASRESFKRLAINPTNGNLVFGNNISGEGSVWTIGRDNLTAEATNIIEGATGIDKVNAICYDENGSLYVLANITTQSSKYNLYKFADGVQTELTLAGKKIFIDADVAMTSDGRGGLWIAQRRGGITQYSILSHINVAEDKVDFVLDAEGTYKDWFAGNCFRAAIAYNAAESIVAVQGASKILLFKVSYDVSTGAPSIDKYLQVSPVGTSVDGLAFDYAGDLYTVNSGSEKFQKFTLPTDENICTVPAPSSQKLVLGTQCEVTVTVNDHTMGSVTGAGQYEKGTEVTLTPNPVAHHRFVNWTGDMTSTDNPLKFTIEGSVNLIANFEAIPQVTITVTSNNEDMGTVSGGGTYDEGAEVTIAATPKATYRFVKWSDDVTDATRTFPAAEDLTLQAIFEKVPNRAWAYDLSQVADGDNYKFSFVATTAGEATLLFADKDGNELVVPHVVGAVNAGANTVTLPQSTFAGVTKDVYWSVKMDGEEITAVAEITDQAKGIYDFVDMTGVLVDNNPDSKYFGEVYVQMALNGTVGSKTQTAGLFIFDQTLAIKNTDANAGIQPILPSEYTMGDNRNKFHRLEIDPKTGNLTYCYNVADNPAIFVIDRENMAGNATNILAGVAGLTRTAAHCYDAEGTLYVMDIAASKGTIYKIVDGQAIQLTEPNGKWVNASISLAADGKGGLWVSHNRGQMDTYYQLVHVTAAGELDYTVWQDNTNGFEGGCNRGALAYDAERQILAQGRNGKVELYSVAFDATTGVPTLTNIAITPFTANYIDGLAFDYAGDLYVVNTGTKKFYKYTIPTAENICTVPAPASQKLVLGTQYEVTVTVNDHTMGSVEGAGIYEKGTEVTLTPNPVAHHRFVNWTGDMTSTDNPLKFTIEGDVNLTANFEAIPQYTITTSVNDEKMGSVTEGGTYYEGTEVTLTATAKGGYVFVDWSDGVTEETRTFTAGVDMPETLTANFKVAVPRAWAYDLRLDADTDPANYIFTFKTTSAGTATLIFKDEDGNIQNFGTHTATATVAEEKTITIAKTVFDAATKDIYWEVELAGEAIAKMAELTDPNKGIYNFYVPQGVAVDNSPNSMYFGRIYVAEGTTGGNDGLTEMAKQMTAGLFVYNQALEKVQPATGYTGIISQNVIFNTNKPTSTDEINNIRQQMHRVAVDPVTGEVVFAYYKDGATAVYGMNPDNLAGNARNYLVDNQITYAQSLCFDEDGALYVMNNANAGQTGGQIYKVQNGEVALFAAHDKNNQWAVYDNALAADGRGGLWIAQNRYGYDYPILSHVNKNGEVDFAVKENLNGWFPNNNTGSSYRGQLAYNLNENILAFAGNKMVTLFTVAYDGNGKPTLNKLMSTPLLGGGNIDGVAFDYAGDLYVASASAERLYKFVVPTTDNICTVPAPESQIIMKEARYTVTVVADPAEMGTVTEGGEYKAGEKVTLTATANDNYRFVNWTKGGVEVSKDASFEYTVPAENVTITAHFELKPLAMVGVVKRAVQIGESTVVLTHEANGTPHLYKVVDGELEAEISQVGVEAAAAGYLSISDIAATEDGKLVACNYIECTFDPSNTSYFYIWNNLAGDPTIWFTSQKSTNYNNAYMGWTMAVKGTSTDAVVTISGFNKSNKNTRFSHLKLVGGVYNEANYEYSRDNAALHVNALGNSYELNASPLANANWIVDGELTAPIEFVGKNAVAIDTYTEMGETLLGKKFNGATYLTVLGKHLMVAPYADGENVAGVTVLDITNGLDQAEEMDYAELTSPVLATAAATAVKVNGDDLTITLVVDNKVYIFSIDLNLQYTRTVTNGNFGTICLPYGSNNYSGAEFYEISYLQLKDDGVTPMGIWLDEVIELEAGKPYIFKATSNLLTVNYKGEEALSPVDGKAGLTGTFDGITDETVLQGNYMIADNKFWLCGAGCWLNANRAYIEHDALHATTTPVSPIPGRRRVMMGAAGENTTTGVDNLTEDGVVSTNQATKMVVNGQLIIIRDGVKYNAQGVRL